MRVRVGRDPHDEKRPAGAGALKLDAKQQKGNSDNRLHAETSSSFFAAMAGDSTHEQPQLSTHGARWGWGWG